MNKGFKGFTYIEIFFVLIIISFLCGLSYHHLKTWTEQAEDEVIKQYLLKLIADTQSQADLTHQALVICPSQHQEGCGGEWQQGQLIFYDDYGDGQLHHSGQIFRLTNLPKWHGQLYWRAYPRYRQTWVFQPSETFTTDNATLWHCHDNKPIWAIVVNQTGHARFLTPSQGDEKLSCGNNLTPTRV